MIDWRNPAPTVTPRPRVALYVREPTGGVAEVSSEGYARVAMPDLGTITFAEATDDWGTVVAAAAWGAPNESWWLWFDQPCAIYAGDSLSLTVRHEV